MVDMVGSKPAGVPGQPWHSYIVYEGNLSLPPVRMSVFAGATNPGSHCHWDGHAIIAVQPRAPSPRSESERPPLFAHITTTPKPCHPLLLPHHKWVKPTLGSEQARGSHQDDSRTHWHAMARRGRCDAGDNTYMAQGTQELNIQCRSTLTI